MKLNNYIKTGKITKQGKHYRCEICNYYADTPFEAIKCYDRCKALAEANISPAQQYWSKLDRNQMQLERSNFNQLSEEEYNKFETVADYAYSMSCLSLPDA